MNFDSHPIQQIIDLLRNTDSAVLQFSEYSYIPQEILDERRCFDVPIGDVSQQWLASQLQILPQNKEIAFHSLVKIGKVSMHIPMIDFCCELDELTSVKTVLSQLLPLHLFSSLQYYKSGRSIHAYGSTLLKPTEWRNLMGRLLLANLPNQNPVVDTRWIGHRILGGYSALRFSCNSNNYLQYPELL